MLKYVLLGLIVAGALVSLLLWSQQDTGPLQVSGHIEAHDIRIGSRVGGRVKAVHVDEGQTVKQGDTLVELEPFDLPQRRDEAAARCDQLKAQLDELIAGPRKQEIEAARAQLAESQSQLELAQQQFNRFKSLVESHAESPDKFDQAAAQLKIAAAAVDVRRQQLTLLIEGTRSERIVAAKAALASAAASLAAIQRQIDELTIRSPITGDIEAVELRPGDLVAANAPVLSMLDQSKLWVRAYVPENHLGIHIGQTCSVHVDSFSDQTFAGTITFISRQAEFTPGNIQTPEERSKQVFRIKVTLDDPRKLLHAGMTADVTFENRGSEAAADKEKH
ncbi:MAG: HlyD family secretion protein [Phycisphaerales bacterium]